MTQPKSISSLAQLTGVPHPLVGGGVRGQQTFLQSGNFIVPAGVASVCVVAVGPGLSAGATSFGPFLTVRNGLDGTSTPINSALKIGGGNGGVAALPSFDGGGGGAGGYMGNGGNSPNPGSGLAADAGSGGGGGGAFGFAGGGVGLDGIGVTGGGSAGAGIGGSGGSDGNQSAFNKGGIFGGGGGYDNSAGQTYGGYGGDLRWRNDIPVSPGQVIAVTIAMYAGGFSGVSRSGLRVIWGSGRSFPYNAA